MNNIINKIIIFFSLLMISFSNLKDIHIILPIVITVSVTCFLEYFNNKYLNYIIFITYCILCLFYSQFSYFIPLIAYDLLLSKFQYIGFLGFIVLLNNISYCGYMNVLILTSIFIAEYILKLRSTKADTLKSEYVFQRDSLKEKSINLETKLSELQYRQDEEISIAKLNERNRIAREIHDNVGHLLSSSIIQIGAIIATTTDENTKESLKVVKETLNNGMNSIRNSVHDLRDDSIDLYEQLKKIKDNFKFCQINLDYDVNINLEVKLKYAIINIVKEALSNVIKHSNANNVEIKLYEHPKIIQLIIYDNGNNVTEINSNGMGIEGIKQRVEILNGIVNFNNNDGFRIFVCFNL